MKKKTSISDRTLNLINQQKIKPRPRWEFVVRNWGLWMALAVSMVLVVLGTGVTWFGLVDNLITPYLWVFVAIVFFGVAYGVFEKTKNAYRFPKWQVGLIIAVVSLVIGGIIFKIGWAGKVDRTLESKVSFYRQMVPMRMMVWSKPEEGYLSGQIIATGKELIITDFNGKQWNITGNPIVRGRVVLAIGEEIKLIGKQIDSKTFEAEEIRPWNGMMQNMMKEN